MWPVFPTDSAKRVSYSNWTTSSSNKDGFLLKVLGSDIGSVPVLPLTGSLTLATLHRPSLPIFFLCKMDMMMTS